MLVDIILGNPAGRRAFPSPTPNTGAIKNAMHNKRYTWHKLFCFFTCLLDRGQFKFSFFVFMLKTEYCIITYCLDDGGNHRFSS
jgi:hypothetical protein